MDISKQFIQVKCAAREMVKLTDCTIQKILIHLAKSLRDETELILDANSRDLQKMDPEASQYDRLLLTKERILNIAKDVEQVARLDSPLSKILDHRKLENGLVLQKTSVPLGVVGVIYEARPNVTVDVFALCLKSGNACVLKGGSDAMESNNVLVSIIKKVLVEMDLSPQIIQLLPTDRSATLELMNASEYVDVLIPRGSQELINTVRQNATVPVIETGAGIVHTYFDKYGDVNKGINIILNAKTRRVSVCNALDCLIVHSDRLMDLPQLVGPLAAREVEIYADTLSWTILKDHYPSPLLHIATDESFGTEFLSYKMSIKTVDHFQEALDHIHLYSSKHSEAIICENEQRTNNFLLSVDAAAVYANCSTAFTDGAQFGLGAEIGISTQKLHARGPMGLKELTSYKWLVHGNGQIRKD